MFRSHLETERRERDTVSEFPKSVEQVEVSKKIKVKVRFDYKGLPRQAKFFFGGKSSREVAEEIRQQQAGAWRNVPIQGVRIDDVDYFELYSVYDEVEEAMVTYAPLEIKATLDSLDDCLRFVSKEEYRRMQIIEPSSINLDSRDLERIFFRFNETLQQKLRDLEFR